MKAVDVERYRDVLGVGVPERGIDELRVRAVVLVDLEADRAGVEKGVEGAGIRRACVSLQPDVHREVLEAAKRPLHRRGRLVEAGADQGRHAAGKGDGY